MSDNVKLQLPRRRDLQELVDSGLIEPKEIPIELGRYFLKNPISESSQADILNKMQGHVRIPPRGDGFSFSVLKAKWDFNLGKGKADVSNLRILPYSGMRTLDVRCNFTQSDDSKRSVGEINGGFYNTHIVFIGVFSLPFKGFKDIGIRKDLNPQKQIEHFKEWIKLRYNIDLNPITYTMTDEFGNLWLVQKPSLLETEMRIHCGCPFYRFYVSYANVIAGKIDLSGKYISYTRKYRSRYTRRNPNKIIGECKHIYFLVSKLSDDRLVVDSYNGVKIDAKSLSDWYSEYNKEIEQLNKPAIGVVRDVDSVEDDVGVVSAEEESPEVSVVKSKPQKDGVSVAKEKTKKSRVSVQNLGKADKKTDVSVEKTDEPLTDEPEVSVEDIGDLKKEPDVSVFADEDEPEIPDISDIYKDREEKPKKRKKAEKEKKTPDYSNKEKEPAVTVTEIPKAKKEEPQEVQPTAQKPTPEPVVHDKHVTNINPDSYYKDVEEPPIVLTPPLDFPDSLIIKDEGTSRLPTVGGVPIKVPNKGLVNAELVPKEDSEYYLALWNSIKDALYMKTRPQGYPTQLLNSLGDFVAELKAKPEWSIWRQPSVVDLLMIVALNLNKEAIDSMKRNIYDDVDLIADDFGSLRKFIKLPVINTHR